MGLLELTTRTFSLPLIFAGDITPYIHVYRNCNSLETI